MVLTPEIVRILCRNLGGSTNSQARDVEDACERILEGQDYQQVIKDIAAENDEFELVMTRGVEGKNEKD